MSRQPIYSGPLRTGICVCGCRWDQHHLCMVMNADYAKETGEAYIPDECCAFGCNEEGGMKWNPKTEEMEDHCHKYRDMPHLITTSSGLQGYDSALIDEALGPRWNEWARGITMSVYTKPDGTQGCLVYKTDVDDFLAGRPNLD